MTRYEECLGYVRRHVAQLREAPRNLNPSAIEGLVRSYVQQPGFDATFRERLIEDALGDGR